MTARVLPKRRVPSTPALPSAHRSPWAWRAPRRCDETSRRASVKRRPIFTLLPASAFRGAAFSRDIPQRQKSEARIRGRSRESFSNPHRSRCYLGHVRPSRPTDRADPAPRPRRRATRPAEPPERARRAERPGPARARHGPARFALGRKRHVSGHKLSTDGQLPGLSSRRLARTGSYRGTNRMIRLLIRGRHNAQ